MLQISENRQVKMVSLTVYSVVIFSHSYFDSDGINFKTFVFLAVNWSNRFNNFCNGASTMLNNVFNIDSKNKTKQ